MLKIRKTQLILLWILVIIAISGCLSSNAPTTTRTPVPTVDPRPAYNAITQAQSFYQTVESDFSSASSPVNEAISRGVETTGSSAVVSSLQSKLSNANNILNTALNNYNSQNYPQAKSYAEQSLAIMQDVQSQLGQIKQAIENDYKVTAAKYKPQFVEAERQYRIAQKYIETVEMVGTDVSGQKSQLHEVMTTLNQAKESYKNNSFIGLSGKINNIISTSKRAQDELTDLYYDALIVEATKKVESHVAFQDAKSYLLEAKVFHQQKEYQEAVISLNKALVTDTQVSVSANVDKLKKAVRSNWSLEVSSQVFDSELSSLRSYVAEGNFDAAGHEIAAIKTDVLATSENAGKVADASKFVEDTSKLSFWWAAKSDTSASNAKLGEAKRFLAQGNHASAADASLVAIDLAINERGAFWSKVKSDWVLGSFLSISKAFSDPEKYEMKSVERPQFEWKAMPELIKIEFGRPIADVSNMVIEDIGTPILPTIQSKTPTTTAPISSPQKKPVNFELDPGTQIECGTTCRETTATLKNTGDETAHDVCVTLEVYNRDGQIIYINGGSSLRRCIGDLPGGQSKSEKVRIEADCGFLFSKCLAKPLTMKSRATSNERAVEFPIQQFS